MAPAEVGSGWGSRLAAARSSTGTKIIDKKALLREPSSVTCRLGGMTNAIDFRGRVLLYL